LPGWLGHPLVDHLVVRAQSIRSRLPLADARERYSAARAWLRGAWDFAAAVRFFLLTLGLVLASAVLVGVVAIRGSQAASEATLEARLHDGEASFSQYSSQRLTELEALVTWLARNPASLETALRVDATADSAALAVLDLGDADFVAVRGKDGEIRVAPSELQPSVTTFLDRAAALNPRRESAPSDVYRMPGGPGVDGGLVAISEAITPSRDHVVAGFFLSHTFADEFFARTGLNLMVFNNGRTVATNLTDDGRRTLDVSHPSFGPIEAERGGTPLSGSFLVGTTKYAAHYLPLNDGGGRTIGAYSISLPTTGAATPNTPLDGDTFFALLALMALAILAGTILARRVVLPMRSLRLAVAQMGEAASLESSAMSVGSIGGEMESLAEEIQDMHRRLMQTHSQLVIEKGLYQGTFQSMADGVFTTNHLGQMTSANPALIETLQAEVSPHQGCCGTNILKDTEGRPLCEVACSWLWLRGQAEPVVVKGFLEPASGPMRDVEMTVTPIKDPQEQTVALVHVVRDVSSQEQLQRLKERFLMSVSHELRTPISALSTSVEFLKDEFLSLGPDDRERLLETVQRSSRRLQNLTVNLLDLGSIQSGTFSVKAAALDLQEPLHEAIALSELVLTSKNQQTVVGVPPDLPEVWADNVRIVQVLVNLIGNAAKYGPLDDSIHITLEELPEKIRVSVTDHGGGIPPEEKARLFDYFFRGSTAGRTETGFGIGLAITRGIIEAHKGEIGVTSTPKDGTTFWFTLPRADR
jgi:two-component system, OmpR family, sensor histidine kinase ResE